MMITVVKFIAILMVACGAIYLVKPEIMRQVTRIMAKENRLYIGSILNLFIGIIFLFSARQCVWPWFIVLLGLISLLKGSLVFMIGTKKIILKLERLTQVPDKILRIMALIYLTLGIILIYNV